MFADYVRAVCLPFADYLQAKSYDNRTLTTTGWFRKGNEISQPIGVKAFSKQRIITQKVCQQKFQNFLLSIEDLHICSIGLRE